MNKIAFLLIAQKLIKDIWVLVMSSWLFLVTLESKTEYEIVCG